MEALGVYLKVGLYIFHSTRETFFLLKLSKLQMEVLGLPMPFINQGVSRHVAVTANAADTLCFDSWLSLQHSEFPNL